MQPDYPAAHSMDTFWFAVDRDGHVAMFNSGEAGAVPVQGYLGEEWGATLEALEKLPGQGSSKDDDNFEVVLNHGVFYYSHEKTENIVAGPYTQMKPGKPVKIDQLPPEAREVVERVKFDSVSFESTKEIQPVEFFPSQAWSGAYLDKDGVTVRPIPGMEKEYADEYARFAEDIPEYRWEAPPAGLGKARPDPAPRLVVRQTMSSDQVNVAGAWIFKVVLFLAIVGGYVAIKIWLLK